LKIIFNRKIKENQTMILATTEIQQIETSIELVAQSGIEIDLDTVLTEFDSNLPNDINNGW